MGGLPSLVMRGRLQAVLVAAAFAALALLFPPLSILAAAVVALVALREGPWPGLIVAGFASVAYGALAVLQFASPALAFGLFLLLAPVWALGLALRATRSLDLTVHGAMLIGLVVALAYSVQVTPEQWQGQLEPLSRALQDAGVVDEQQAKSFIAVLVLWMPGVLAAGFFVELVLALFIGRSWQAKLYNPGGFQAEFHQLRLHRALAFLVLPLLGVLFLRIEGAWSLIHYLGPLLTVAYFFQGLAVAHGLVARTKMHRAWLYVLYALLALAMGYTVLAVAALGYTDAWLNYRARVSRTGRNSD